MQWKKQQAAGEEEEESTEEETDWGRMMMMMAMMAVHGQSMPEDRTNALRSHLPPPKRYQTSS
jgi:hypothetical protein